MPAVERLNDSPSADKIKDALTVGAYSYPDQSVSAVQRQDSQHSENNPLLEYMMLISLSGRLQKKINDMKNLKPNWDTYGAEPPESEAKNVARELLVCMERRRFLPTDAVASTEGGVALSFMSENRYADIECLNTGEILAVTVIGQEEPVVWEVAKSNASFIEAIERIHDHIFP